MFAGLCALNGAFYPAVAKLTTTAADPLFVTAATTGFGGLTAAIVLGTRGQLRQLVQRSTAPYLALVGFLGTTLAFILFFIGAERSSAIDTVLCLQAEPIYSLIMSWIFLGHRPTPRRLVAIGVLIGGIVLALGDAGFADPVGVGILLLTPLCWQLSHLVALRRLLGVPPLVLTGARYVYGGIFVVLYWFVSGGETGLADRSAIMAQLPLLALQGVVLGYVGTLLWYQAIARLDLARATAVVVPSIPLLSLVASFTLLGEIPTESQSLGLILTATGVFLFLRAPHPVEARERIPTQTAPIAAPEAFPASPEKP